MDSLENVCKKSFETWIDSLPKEVPNHSFSQKHIEKMNSLFEKDVVSKPKKITKNILKFIIIAAVLLGIATTAFAVSMQKDAIIKKYDNHSTYDVFDSKKDKKIKFLDVGYIPSGYEKTDEMITDYLYYYVYEKGEKSFIVDKFALSTSIGFDTEEYESENIKINGMDAVYYKSDESTKGLIFNDGEYIYSVTGNIDKDELIKIAENVK